MKSPNIPELLSRYFLDLKDEHLWPHVEFRTLGGVCEHVDYLLAVNALMIKICHDMPSSVMICHDHHEILSSLTIPSQPMI